MNYVKVTAGVATEYNLKQLRKDNPNVSFPKEPRSELLADWDVFTLNLLPDPAYDPETEKLVEQPIQQINGVWVKFSLAEPMTQDELDARLTQKRARMRCTPRQARLALSRSGKYGEVRQFLAQLPADQKEEAEIEWEYATEFERTNGLLVTLTAAMGMTEQEVDDLFNLARTL